MSSSAPQFLAVRKENSKKKRKESTPLLFHTFIHQSQQRKRRSAPSERFINLNNGVTSSNGAMAHSLSSPQPWFPHVCEEKEKKRNESFETFYRIRIELGFYRRPHPPLTISCLGERGQTRSDLTELSRFVSRLLSGTGFDIHVIFKKHNLALLVYSITLSLGKNCSKLFHIAITVSSKFS